MLWASCVGGFIDVLTATAVRRLCCVGGFVDVLTAVRRLCCVGGFVDVLTDSDSLFTKFYNKESVSKAVSIQT